LVAFAVYCRTPFGKLHSRNPQIVSVATALGRSPGSLAKKCCNLASLDETHRSRGVKGLQNVSQTDREVWGAFLSSPETLCFEAATELSRIQHRGPGALEPELPEPLGLDREGLVRLRVNQHFFREMILSGYRASCAVCSLPIPSLLVASHIVPWAADATLRMNPRNSLCLCGTHDRAYERGVLRIGRDFIIQCVIDDKNKTSPAVRDWLTRYESARICLPERWQPDPELLARKLLLLSQSAS
jgi:putative restriction endonuclease